MRTICYETVGDLFQQNPRLEHEKSAVVYLINWPCGFGSAMQIHLAAAHYIHSINPDILVVPHFSQNSNHFKYHDETLENSFFSYFALAREEVDCPVRLHCFYARATPLQDRDAYKFRLPMSNPFNETLRREFVWTPRATLREAATEFVATFGGVRPLIGLHARAIVQKQQEYARYAAAQTVKQRFDALKRRLDASYPDGYDVFVATDVDYYLEGATAVFAKHPVEGCGPVRAKHPVEGCGPVRVHWLENVARVAYGHTDSMPTLGAQPGIKLGDDILMDCLVLGMCDAVFVGPSNIPLLVWLMNPDAVICDY